MPEVPRQNVHTTEDFTSTKLYNVAGRIALVSGGGSGIGLMIAQGLCANGAKVYIVGRREDALTRAVKHHNHGEGEIIALQGDVSSKEDLARLANEIEQREGKLHILVNNAGRAGPKTLIQEAGDTAEEIGNTLFEAETFEQWDQTFNLNVASIYFCTTAFVPLLSKGAGDFPEGPSVLNITSVSGITKISQNHFAYNASKAASNHLTKMMSYEFVEAGIPIRVNAIAPGVFPSELTAKCASDPLGRSDISHRKDLSWIPGGVGSAEDMAATSRKYSSVLLIA